MWLSPTAIASWHAKPSGRRGGQQKYSDVAIETALTLGLMFHLPLRQTEGFVGSLFEIMNIHLQAPDHTTLSRRGQQLNVRLRPSMFSGSVHLVIDSSGLAIFGKGQWAAAKHGGKGMQGWKKLHLGVDQAGFIVAQVLTDSNVDDATTGVDIIGQVKRDISTVIGDAAYDTRPIYKAAKNRGAKVVVPPIKTAREGRPRSPERDRTARRVRKVGIRQWKKEAGYHRQGRTENTFFRYKLIFGSRLRARGANAQVVGARLACKILKRLRDLGRPASVALGT